MLALRYIHDHPSGKIKTRLDRIDLDILGIVRMGAKTAQPEPFNDGRLGLERREGGVGAAAFGHVADHLCSCDTNRKFPSDLLCVSQPPKPARVSLGR